MNTLINLLKDHQIGMWCKRAAWIILVIGLVEVPYNIWNISQQLGSTGQPLTLGELIQILGFGLAMLPGIIFEFFILYAAGAVANHVVGTQEMDDETDEEQDNALRQ